MRNLLIKRLQSGVPAWALLLVIAVMLLPQLALADAPKTEFTATETVVGMDPPMVFPAGTKIQIIATQYAIEESSDPRVSGDSIIHGNLIQELPAMTALMWGSYRLTNADGEWNGHWQGSRTLTNGDIVISTLVTAIGSGAYEGLIAKWHYTGAPDNPQFNGTGYIVEAAKGHVEVPMTWSATRTELMTLYPFTMGFEIAQEVGVGTHIGRSTNTGVGFLVPTDPQTGSVTGTGCLTAANGDLVYWVVTGSVDLTGQNGAAVSGYFAGGTGRFEYAVGQMDGTLLAQFLPTSDPNVLSATFSYMMTGNIRY